MYAQCPQCLTIFTLDAATIALAHGVVGCGECGATFDVTATLCDTLPEEPFETLPLNNPGASPPLLLSAVPHAAPPQSGLFEGVPSEWGVRDGRDASAEADAPPTLDTAMQRIASAGSAGATALPGEAPAHDMPEAERGTGATDEARGFDVRDDDDLEPLDEPPEFDPTNRRYGMEALAELDDDTDAAVGDDTGGDADASPDAAPFRRRPRRRSWLGNRWVLGCLLLAVCLVAQLAWAKRAALARDPHTGPLLRQFCAALHLPPPLASDLSRLSLVSRDVRRHPSAANALMISATLRNDAPFAQPYPVIVITLSNLDDRRIAMRRFRPSEYVRDAEVRRAGIAPGAQTAVVFEVADPGQDAVAFRFAFQ
ncbi:MAG TPA: zinc-ribbon and DUF3426 domain-containing protein [Rhodanobacteraceae bacterium]|nr:zinc-ribbon and DUF3426 domain-containing protein [Rhodanobacteraceae bacterium]